MLAEIWLRASKQEVYSLLVLTVLYERIFGIDPAKHLLHWLLQPEHYHRLLPQAVRSPHIQSRELSQSWWLPGDTWRLLDLKQWSLSAAYVTYSFFFLVIQCGQINFSMQHLSNSICGLCATLGRKRRPTLSDSLDQRSYGKRLCCQAEQCIDPAKASELQNNTITAGNKLWKPLYKLCS